ncbi:MAG: nucleotidyltransferase substrate binding protein [Deltaproteobacteria bacterium]|nr:nucleotidyltransferase substrate binding protein [Deltaproteobacteria bacterium]
MAHRKKLPRTLEKFEAGFNKLKEAVTKEFEAKFDKDIITEIVIKRFEYTFETLWKTLKELLISEGIEATSPLSCFKEAFNIGLIEKEYEEIFPLMVKKRNEIVHIYSDEDAYETYLLIKSTFITAIQSLHKSLLAR